MKATDKSVGELIQLLEAHPDLVDALFFNPERIQQLLKSKGARKVALGIKVKRFLQRAATGMQGGPIALCLSNTSLFCGGGTRYRLGCGGGTKRPGTLPGPSAKSRQSRARKTGARSS